METLLSRFRNITVLLLVIFAQLILLAYQVKNDKDVRLIRLAAVTAVTPLARVIESVRGGTFGFLQDYVVLRDRRVENERLKTELGQLKLENQYLKSELSTADRARSLAAFETRTPSKMIAARVIATATGASASSVFVDRGSTSGVQKGMAVVTPDGIVGKVLAAYPTASQVLLVTDPSFAAGVISQKNHTRGVLKGLGHGTCHVDYVQNEEKVETGEGLFTSGDDRVFPKGLPVGRITSARPGNTFQDITVEPSGLAGGIEEVLIVLAAVHQQIPELKTSTSPVYLAPSLPAAPAEPSGAAATGANPPVAAKTTLATDADRLREHYKEVGDAQNHKFGEGLPGSKPPDFNLQVQPGSKPAVTAAAPAKTPAVKPQTSGTAPPAAPPPAPKPDDVTVQPAPPPQ